MSEQKPGCLFCEFSEATDDRKNLVLERGSAWYLIVNRYPYTTGHIMIVCKRHIEGFADLNGSEQAELTMLLSRGETALRNVYHPEGLNVGANLGRSAGAGIVGHLHIHLVPRWHGDTNFMSSVGETRVVSEDLNTTYDRVVAALNEEGSSE